VLTKDSETNDYDPRLLYAHSLINATEPRKAIHLLHATALPFRRWVDWLNKKDSAFLSTEILQRIAREYWGSTAAADMTTYEGKSLAAKKVQDYGYVKESLILCDLMWPIHQVRSVDSTITCGTLESQIVSAITGREIDEAGLLQVGERVFNLQRMALLRDGWQGRKADTILDYFFEEPLQEVFWNVDCLIPDINGQIVSRKGAVVDRAAFEKMKSEYYAHRGWDTTTGVPTVDKLNQLNLADLIPLSVDIQKSLSQANNIV
jgi:aldehyde:ferredoxin oxidoreductase